MLTFPVPESIVALRRALFAHYEATGQIDAAIVLQLRTQIDDLKKTTDYRSSRSVRVGPHYALREVDNAISI